MKIGRNELCPCGSGKKYKKCCLNKKENSDKKPDIDDIDFMKKHDFIDIFSYHNKVIHTKKVKAPKINKKLLNIYDNKHNLPIKTVINDYLEVMNYILDYAKKNNIHTFKEIDDANLISDFILNVTGDIEDTITNLKSEDYDLNLTNKYIDRLVKIINLDDDIYENNIRCKVHSLFKLGKSEEGEKIILKLINDKNNSIYPYVELVDDYKMIGNLEKSKYYYDLGMKRTDLDELDVLEERSYYFDK